MSASRERVVRIGVPILLVVAFLVNASAYLHFFIDDEAITLKFARNLLDGFGLSYNAGEGHVEGFSNFLHVIVMTAVLGLTRLAGRPDIWAIAGGNALSIACGSAVIVVLWRTLRPGTGQFSIGPIAAGASLALSGPLAVWSASSLETVPFSLAFIALIAAGWRRVNASASIACAIVLVLLRTDGFLWAGAWLSARWITADGPTRQVLFRRVFPGALAATALFAGWRYWYFGSLLSLPLQTKVMHKLVGAAAITVSVRPVPYLEEFVAALGWPLVAVALFTAAMAVVPKATRRQAAALSLALAALTTYIGTVGDWMFGFRFVVPLLAPCALLIGTGIDWLAERQIWLGRLAGVTMTGLAVAQVPVFHRYYVETERRPLFWSRPEISAALKFGRWEEAYEGAVPLMRPGTRMAFHDAGLLPFLLNVPNTDLLGLCDPFIGTLPTLDAIFTDIGRYYPVTPRPPREAAFAYLLSRNVNLLIMQKSWMHTANEGRVPREVLGGYFALAKETPGFTYYVRTDKAPPETLRQPRGYLENLLHPANLDGALVDDAPMTPAQLNTALPALSARPTPTPIGPSFKWSLISRLREETDAFGFYFESAAPPRPVILNVILRDARGATTERIARELPPGAPFVYDETFPAARRTATVELQLASVDGGPVGVTVRAIRLFGQGEALKAHLLKFHVGRN